MPQLVVRLPGQVAFSVPLRDGFTIGRHAQNDLVLYDHQVSRQHLTFAIAEGRCRFSDPGSTHGTLVNGVPTREAELADGARLQVGGVLLEYVAGDEAREIVMDTRAEPFVPSAVPADQRLKLLYEISSAVRAMEDLDALLDRMLHAVVEVLGCERGVIGQVEGSGVRQLAACTDAARSGELVVSRSLVQAVVERREAVVVRDASERNRTLARQGVLSAMCVPLLSGGRVLGFIYVDDRSESGRFNADDLAYLGALASLTAAAMEAAERYRFAVDAAGSAGEGSRDQLIGASPAMQDLAVQLRKYAAAAGANVLVQGETGVGKELVARTLHLGSPRSAYPFQTINCAAIPETMIESELFGYEKGAFTGAVREKRGKFILAHRGTLFLDEIGDLSPAAQAKVLRAIQEGEVQPLGSERSLHVDVRVIAATHKDLLAEIAAGRFREDLYYRLAVVEVHVPPLRERAGDVVLIARGLLPAAAARVGKRIDGFSDEALAALARYAWPGNVRELQNEVERAAIHAEARTVAVGDLSPRVLAARGGAAVPGLAGAEAQGLAERFAELEVVEKRIVEAALEQAKGNVSEAARLLGISRIMVRRRLERFQIQADDD